MHKVKRQNMGLSHLAGDRPIDYYCVFPLSVPILEVSVSVSEAPVVLPLVSAASDESFSSVPSLADVVPSPEAAESSPLASGFSFSPASPEFSRLPESRVSSSSVFSVSSSAAESSLDSSSSSSLPPKRF